MPQLNVLNDWKTNYPRDGKVQKPGGVNNSTALPTNAVPNKAPFAVGTVLIEAWLRKIEE